MTAESFLRAIAERRSKVRQEKKDRFWSEGGPPVVVLDDGLNHKLARFDRKV